MKQFRSIASGATVAAVCLVALIVTPFTAQADVWDKKTVVTVREPIQVQETRLDPGTYVFRLASSSSNRHIVHIFNRDENRVINTILAIPAYRTRPTGDTQFAFYETPPGTARAMKTWYFPGDNYGQEFRYPKEHWLLASTVMPALTRRSAEPGPQIEAEPVTPESPAPEPAVEPEQPRLEELPQNAPAPQDSAEPQSPAAAPAAPEPAKDEPTELPKTGTSYPLVGLLGLGSLGLYGLFRLGRAR